MNERDLAGALEGVLEQAGEQVAVNTPPTAEMLSRHRRGQRRRTLFTTVAASVAVVAATGGLWVATQNGLGGSEDGTVAALPQAKGQWVGMRHVAVDVGTDWTEGRACDEGGAVDTYDVTGFRYVDPHCEGQNPSDQEQRNIVSFMPLSDDVDPARAAQAPGNSAAPVRETEVDGHRVLRSEVWCTEMDGQFYGSSHAGETVTRCMAGLAVPDQGVSLSVWSFEGEKTIEELLDSLRIFDDHVAVPSPLGTFDEYRTEAKRLGLKVDAVTPLGREFTGDADAFVTEVLPEQGTFVPVGSTVDVRVRMDEAEATRLVGLGHVSVDVPEAWDHQAIECGVPERNTYTIENAGSATRACGGFWQPDRTWVQLSDVGTSRRMPSGWSEEQVDGVRAWVQPVRCEAEESFSRNGSSSVEVCTGAVQFVDEGVRVTVQSSAGEDAAQRRLETVRVLPGEIGLPSADGFFNEHQERSGEKYVEHLESLGFEVHVSRRPHDGLDAGFVIETLPEAGEMLDLPARVDVVISSGSD